MVIGSAWYLIMEMTLILLQASSSCNNKTILKGQEHGQQMSVIHYVCHILRPFSDALLPPEIILA